MGLVHSDEPDRRRGARTSISRFEPKAEEDARSPRMGTVERLDSGRNRVCGQISTKPEFDIFEVLYRKKMNR